MCRLARGLLRITVFLLLGNDIFNSKLFETNIYRFHRTCNALMYNCNICKNLNDREIDFASLSLLYVVQLAQSLQLNVFHIIIWLSQLIGLVVRLFGLTFLNISAEKSRIQWKNREEHIECKMYVEVKYCRDCPKSQKKKNQIKNTEFSSF